MLKQWLTTHHIPEEIQNLVLDNSFPYGQSLGSVRFDTPEGIVEWNEFDLWPCFPDNKLLTIGSAVSGDLWAISYRQTPHSVVVLPHDNMPAKKVGVISESLLIKVADSLVEFIRLAVEDKLPLDYYEAKKLRKV